MESLKISEIGERKKVNCGKYRITFKRESGSFLIYIEKKNLIIDARILLLTENGMNEEDFFSWVTYSSGQDVDFVLKYKRNTKSICLKNKELRIVDLVLGTESVYYR